MNSDSEILVKDCSDILLKIYRFSVENSQELLSSYPRLSYVDILKGVRIFLDSALDSSDTYSWFGSIGYKIEDFCGSLVRDYCRSYKDIKILLFTVDYLLSVLEYNEFIHNCNFKDTKA